MAEAFNPSDYAGVPASFGSYQTYLGMDKNNPYGTPRNTAPKKSMYDVEAVPPATAPQDAAAQPVVPPLVTAAPPANPFGAPSSGFNLPSLTLPTTQSMMDAVKKHLGDF
jgi:hypothetical protein